MPKKFSIFEKSELGRIKKLIPLREMAETFCLVRKSMSLKLLYKFLCLLLMEKEFRFHYG